EDLLTLRTTLDATMQQRPRRIAFASLGPEEGTTTVLAGFVRLLAGDRSLRIAAVDANITAPSLARQMGAEAGPGVAEILSGTATAANALATIDGTDVHVMPAGRGDPRHLHPDADAIERLVGSFGGYDYVLVDCAPLLSWPHSVSIAAACDGVVLVV